MCGPALPPCLLLWIIGAAVVRTHGEVTAPASLTAEAGQPITLGCNITIKPGYPIMQVRWQNRHKKMILAYKQTKKVDIIYQEDGVQLTSHNDHASYITIKKVRPDDDGCYHCFFDVFPLGQQEGKTCIKVFSKIHLDGNKTAVSGKSTSLSCRYSLSEMVDQVLWKKTAEQGDTAIVASYNKRGYHEVREHFRQRVSLSRTLGNTRLTIQSVRTEDEACYTCEFHTFPDGIRSDAACLSVYVLPKPEVSHVTSPSGTTEANCTAQSRPAAEITWNISGDNRTLGPPVLSVYDQGDGTTIVTSTVLFQSGMFTDAFVKCIVHHQGLEKPLTVSLNPRMEPAVVILLSVCGVAAILLLCLCVCLCKCFVCTDD